MKKAIRAAIFALAALLAAGALGAEEPKAAQAESAEVFAQIAKGDAAWLKDRLGKGLDIRIKSQGGSGWGLVGGCSAYIDDPELYRLLKAKGADMSEVCPNGYSALINAIGYGKYKAAAALLELGADTAFTSKDGMNALRAAAQAAKDRPFLERLCASIPKAALDEGDALGYTPLDAAIASNNPIAFAVLLEAGASVDAAPLPSGASPLHFAAALPARSEYLGALVARKAKLEQRAAKAISLPGGVKISAGATPLVVAAERGGSEAAKILLDAGADPLAVNGYSRDFLHLVAGKSSFSPMILPLLKARPELLESRDKQGHTPLHIAMMRDGEPAAVKLLLDAGAEINALDRAGSTPLELALYSCSDPYFIEDFIEWGGKVSNLDNALGILPDNSSLANHASTLGDLLKNAVLSK